MNTLTINLKREFWEHRSLYIAPLVWAAIITVMFAYVIFFVVPHDMGPHGNFNGHISMGPDGADATAELSDAERKQVADAIARSAAQSHGPTQKVYAAAYLGNSLLVAGFACIVVFFYLIDCLYSERRDRSILFWKSLPISDAQVVLSKLAIALVIVPLGAILLAMAMQLVMLAMVWLRFHGSAVWGAFPDWSFVEWFKSLVMALGLGLVGVLWYAPIAGYLLLMSSWARRNVFLWAVLPPIALIVLELFFFHTSIVARFFGERFVGFVRQIHVDPTAFNVGSRDGGAAPARVNDIFNTFDLSGVFMHADMWLGLVAAAAMVFVAIRLRRYRDES